MKAYISNRGIGDMPYDMRCPMCGSYGIKDICNSCGLPFCINHIFRHRNCKEGR